MRSLFFGDRSVEDLIVNDFIELEREAAEGFYEFLRIYKRTIRPFSEKCSPCSGVRSLPVL